LIERRSTPRTDSAPSAADWPGPPVSRSNQPFPAAPRRIWAGSSLGGLARSDPARICFFLEIRFKFDLICELEKFIEYSLYEQID
jgi:hypothetical protein